METVTVGDQIAEIGIAMEENHSANYVASSATQFLDVTFVLKGGIKDQTGTILSNLVIQIFLQINFLHQMA